MQLASPKPVGVSDADNEVMVDADRELDKWASWLLHRRDGDDRAQYQKALEHLVPISDRVLDNAAMKGGETLLDVGAGDGLIAFAALERVGKSGRVIASDISEDLVTRMRETADDLGVLKQMSFVRASDDLGPIDDDQSMSSRLARC